MADIPCVDLVKLDKDKGWQIDCSRLKTTMIQVHFIMNPVFSLWLVAPEEKILLLIFNVDFV